MVYEPTDPCHRAFEAALADDLPPVKVNSKHARRFAESEGELAKTDRADARQLPRISLFSESCKLPAIVATQYNPDLKAKYDRMKAAAKRRKIAITAIMRKRLILANTLINEDREWAAIRA